jgi:hypothetical protein
VAHDLVREVLLADLPELRGAALRRLGRLEESSGELRAAAMAVWSLSMGGQLVQPTRLPARPAPIVG